jgi:hypothetical protein
VETRRYRHRRRRRRHDGAMRRERRRRHDGAMGRCRRGRGLLREEVRRGACELLHDVAEVGLVDVVDRGLGRRVVGREGGRRCRWGRGRERRAGRRGSRSHGGSGGRLLGDLVGGFVERLERGGGGRGGGRRLLRGWRRREVGLVHDHGGLAEEVVGEREEMSCARGGECARLGFGETKRVWTVAVRLEGRAGDTSAANRPEPKEGQLRTAEGGSAAAYSTTLDSKSTGLDDCWLPLPSAAQRFSRSLARRGWNAVSGGSLVRLFPALSGCERGAGRVCGNYVRR